MFVGIGVRAQQAVDPSKAEHFSIAPKALYDAASAVGASEGSNVVLLEDDDTFSFDEAGRYSHTGYVVYKVLTQQGAEGWDSLSVEWEPWHEARPVIRARVISADMTVHTLDPKSISEAPAREGDYKTYSDGKRLHAPFPAIAPGVVVEEEYVESESEPFFAPGHTGWLTFGREQAPVAHSIIQLEAPASLPLRTSTLLLDDLKPVRTEAGGKVTLTYERGRMEGIDARDPNLPPDEARFPEVRFSTGKSWQAMATAYSAIVDSHAGPAAVQAIVDKLTAGKQTAAEKESAIVNYLDHEVRYTGIEFGEAAIVPHDPAETLSKKYGDCKDKATLLVTMLGAAGIHASVALLNAGSRMDVDADLPGMGLFDHAIVYVPGGAGPNSPALWIDATDKYARLGQLPIVDQGRLAMIASPETTALVKTPESASKDNVLLELREMTLSENGPAAVTEKTQPLGVFESRYRSYYADKPDKDMRESLTGYVKSQYVAEKLSSVDRSDPEDLSSQFELTLACEKARRGYTDLDNAQAAIRLDTLFARLPDDLKRKDDTEEKAKKDDKDKPKKPRTADWELGEPFEAEWRYKVIPPAGFVAKELPANTRITVGPALLTEEFSADKNGVVMAHLTFDSVKRRYTIAEATELRNKVADLIAGPAILVNFEPQGAALMHAGKVKEALAAYRGLIALHPNEAVHHLQVAKVLLEAGMGEAARAEARQAIKLEPNSAVAEKILAQILKFDLVGRHMRAGSDLAGAADAYRASIKLDPDEHSTQGDLAILLEYDPVGRRYSGQSKMKEAIAEYQKLGQDKLADLGLTQNLAYALAYGGEPEGAIKAAQNLNPQPTALLAASEAILHGSKAGLARANALSNGDSDFKQTATTAGKMLMRVRQYPQAADFLEAGASGDDAAWAIGLANTLRVAQHHEEMHFADTPADLVKRYFLLANDPELTEAKLSAVLSRSAQEFAKQEDADARKVILEAGKRWNSRLGRDDTSMDVELDIDLQRIDPKGEGNDAAGYREKFQVFDRNTTYFVVKEDGKYKLLATEDRPTPIALEMLNRINAGDLQGCKVLVDWLREDEHLEGGDDPLGGLVFPRFWMKGEAADARKMKLAAASILVGSKATVDQGVALLEEGQKDASGERERTNIQLALLVGYSVQDNFARLLEVATALQKQEPESKRAFFAGVDALIGLGRYDDAMGLSDQRLKLLDGDSDALLMKMRTDADRGNFTGARAWAQKLADAGKEDAELWNSSSWFALFTGKVNDADIAMAIKSTQMAKDNPHILHTLACLYAEAGKAKEAHDVLMRSMDDLNLDEPNDDYWYALGRIAEQYGERDIAIGDYRKLSKPKEPLAIPTSSYRLAQTRLKALGADAGGK
jgi:transglutaminase-like putative cysteine protease/Flp pilus assembly protein TadD